MAENFWLLGLTVLMRSSRGFPLSPVGWEYIPSRYFINLPTCNSRVDEIGWDKMG